MYQDYIKSETEVTRFCLGEITTTAPNLQDKSHSSQPKMKVKSIFDRSDENFPPAAYIEQIALNIPETLTTYIQLWKHKDNTNKLIVKKTDIHQLFLRQYTSFEIDLMKICAQGLLSYSYNKKNKAFTIELTGWDNELGED
jgi:hypothetical protein